MGFVNCQFFMFFTFCYLRFSTRAKTNRTNKLHQKDVEYEKFSRKTSNSKEVDGKGEKENPRYSPTNSFPPHSSKIPPPLLPSLAPECSQKPAQTLENHKQRSISQSRTITTSSNLLPQRRRPSRAFPAFTQRVTTARIQRTGLTRPSLRLRRRWLGSRTRAGRLPPTSTTGAHSTRRNPRHGITRDRIASRQKTLARGRGARIRERERDRPRSIPTGGRQSTKSSDSDVARESDAGLAVGFVLFTVRGVAGQGRVGAAVDVDEDGGAFVAGFAGCGGDGYEVGFAAVLDAVLVLDWLGAEGGRVGGGRRLRGR